MVWRRIKFSQLPWNYNCDDGGYMTGEELGVTWVLEGHGPWSHDEDDRAFGEAVCIRLAVCGWRSGLILMTVSWILSSLMMTMVSSSFLLFQKDKSLSIAWSWVGPSHEYLACEYLFWWKRFFLTSGVIMTQKHISAFSSEKYWGRNKKQAEFFSSGFKEASMSVNSFQDHLCNFIYP